jgi:DMSO reductase anchor subunit
MEVPLCVFVVAAHCSTGGVFALLCFGQALEMLSKPKRSLGSSREFASMWLEPDTAGAIANLERST